VTPTPQTSAVPAETITAQLGQHFGAANVISDANGLANYEVDGMRPAAAVTASSAEDIAELLRIAAKDHVAVIPCAGRTKLRVGMPPARYDVALDVSRMNKILGYEPRDLTLRVEPGIRFADLAATLARERQFLPLNPPFLQRATIGGILAADSVSPLRHAYGSARDFVLGMEFVSGNGTASKSGGRVVKNVSGYDLHKLLIGSLGTLAVITAANFKTFPMPPAQIVLIAAFASSASALQFCRLLAKSPLEASQVDILSPEMAELLKSETQKDIALAENKWAVTISAAGSERVVERHRREITVIAQQAESASCDALGDTHESRQTAAALLGAIREFPALAFKSDRSAVIFRIAALPSAMDRLALELSSAAADNSIRFALLLRPYGFAYFALLPSNKSTSTPQAMAQIASRVFQTCAEVGAKASIESAPLELKRAVNIWGPARPDFELMRRVKTVFDPAGILSPGRFAGGI
jgi:glycolate oxidase FAD binding subunit